MDCRAAHLVLAVALLLCACATGDATVPWDTADMVRQLMDGLRQHEHVGGEVMEFDVLGWRVTENADEPTPVPPGLPPVVRRNRTQGALVWVRIEREGATPEWLLIDGLEVDGEWRRGVYVVEWMKPPARLRPGETADGTYHGFAKYPRPPTAEEVCEFANVNFTVTDPAPTGRRVTRITGGFRPHAWRRRTGAGPSCPFVGRPRFPSE